MEFFVFISQEWLLIATLALLMVVYALRERIKNGRPIPAHEVTRLLNSESAVLVDVREASDFKAGHISGALNLPYRKVATEGEAFLQPYKEKVIVVADKYGQHAGAAGRTLGQKGFDVRRLAGGITEWQNQGLPLVKKG
ncbi:rhodanese-like domain-containing protein [Marinimicrobium sp. ARAG 43.8]|uniref:rhodanese-like domain-containing protein n=1 Tax=Marinimicrobium sp. ARAG 43.8 TaxID=3418719 RepID=UPI003CE6EF60